MRKTAKDRIEEVNKFLRDFPENTKAVAEYDHAVETRPGMVMDDYARCRTALARVENAAQKRA